MRPDEDEFEFEFDDDDEEEEEETPKKTKKSSKKVKKTPKKETDKKKDAGSKKATRMPISDGIKRRLIKDMKEISRLKEDLESCESERDSYEKEFEMLEDELETLRSEKENFENELNQKIAVVNAMEKKLDRNQKDFDNFRKRSQNEVDRQIKMGSKDLLLGIIDVLDNFDRALAEARKSDWKSGVKPLVEGIESVRKGLMKLLEDNGVELVDPVGEPFDPNYHEAFEIVEDKTVPENTVIDVDVKGYLLEGMVLRPAKVRVSKGGKPRKKKKEDSSDKKKTKSGGSDKEENEEELEEETLSDEEEEDEIEEIHEDEDLDEAEEIEELDELVEEIDKMDS